MSMGLLSMLGGLVAVIFFLGFLGVAFLALLFFVVLITVGPLIFVGLLLPTFGIWKTRRR